ncbi:uncharacterized protein RJT20DRAFT_47028 [Scheffersomyces xylosifermentans]|uniref:uncharacterized protein n=1 Tax=Scheffersomyces xylosifermentans TaxID=1304137 RepID=UPI00315CCCE8
MKASVLSLIALASTAIAAPMQHQHHQHHQHVEKRDVVTKVVYVDVNGNLIPGPSPTASPSAATTDDKNTVPVTQTFSGVQPSSSGGAGAGGILGDLAPYANPAGSFEDGKYSCDSVPLGNGVISVDWISGLEGGFTSIMNQNGDTSSTCKDGFYCSYACQAGMSKTQWPSAQPANGISVGGLYCKNGLLYRSNTDAENLCEWGAQTASFESQIGQDVAICRTDYPGSENMNIPTLLSAGGSAPVSVVDSDNYYTWRGGKTSTQYYVNNAGVSVEDGCIWGTDGSGVGNWAPVVLGAGTTGGKTYLSLIPNPNNKVPPNYNIKIVGTDGSNVVGNCKYENGQYNGAGTDGCTVTVTSGSAQFVFY